MLRQQLHDQAEHLQQSIDAHARALETPPPPPQLSPEAPPVPLPPPQPPEPIAASYLYETSGGDGEDEEPEWLTNGERADGAAAGVWPPPRTYNYVFALTITGGLMARRALAAHTRPARMAIARSMEAR